MKTFTASEVASLAEVNLGTLRVWRRRGELRIEGEQEGWTRYTLVDLWKVAVFRASVESFLPHELAGRIADLAPKYVAAVLRGGDDVLSPYLLFSGSLDSGASVEVVKGVEALTARVGNVLTASEKYPVLHVVDFISIIARLYDRLHEAGVTLAPDDIHLGKVVEPAALDLTDA